MPGELASVPLLCGRIRVRPQGADDAIAAVASRQHGVVARRQLLAAGVGKRAIEHRLHLGRLRPLFRGVYAVGHLALGPAGPLAAALLAVWGGPGGPAVAASHWSAAAMWGLCGPQRPTHVTVAAQRRGLPRAAVHWAALPGDETAERNGLPLTTVPRTLLDLSAITPPGRLRRLVKEAEFQRLASLEALGAVLRRHPYRRGRRALATIVEGPAMRAGLTRSELEDLFLSFCARHRLPPPQTNLIVAAHGARFEVDCAWPPRKVALELDGYRGHGGRLAFEDDRARDRRLAAAGWTPVRLTFAQLSRGDDALAREILAILEAKRTRS